MAAAPPLPNIHPSVQLFAFPWRTLTVALLIALAVFLLAFGIAKRSWLALAGSAVASVLMILMYWTLVTIAR
jgi:hypothetical protein